MCGKSIGNDKKNLCILFKVVIIVLFIHTEVYSNLTQNFGATSDEIQYGISFKFVPFYLENLHLLHLFLLHDLCKQFCDRI